MTGSLRRWLATGAGVAAIGASVSAAPPAAAHEFAIVLVSAASAKSGDAGRGFELAVDQSPDVSHAPGEAAGDHLGGVDVRLVAISDGEREDTARRVGDLLDAGAAAVIVLFVPSTADAIAAAAAARDKLALVVAEGGPSRRESLLLRPRPPGRIDGAGLAAASSAFQAAFGEDPTQAALLGYDAGKLIDRLVTWVGHALPPTEALMAAALAEEGGLTSSSILGAGGAEGGNTGGGDSSWLPGPRTVVMAAAATLIAAGTVALVRRRRS